MTYAHQPLVDSALPSMAKGIALEIVGDTVLVAAEDTDGSSVALSCDLLWASDARPIIDPGDTVLVWRSGPNERGVIVGRVGPRRGSTANAPAGEDAEPDGPPDELVIEARKTLTLRVGDGSITIREDGKILIKGKDLVSHAQRTNRVRGGTVAIN